MADKFVPREQYKTLEKVADEMLAVLKQVVANLQQAQANQSTLIAQLSGYVSKIETEKNRPESQTSDGAVDVKATNETENTEQPA